MSLMACRGCSTRFAVGLLRCPQCGVVSELYARPDYEADTEEPMPKITVGGGASNALEDAEPEAAPAFPAAEDVQAVSEPAVDTGPDKAAPGAADAEASKPEPAAAPAPKKRAAKKATAAPEA